MWSVYKLLDPDPDPYIVYGSGSGSGRANNIRIRLDPDPDPDSQHWFEGYCRVITGSILLYLVAGSSKGYPFQTKLILGSHGCFPVFPVLSLFLVAPGLAAVLLQAGFPIAIFVVADVCVEPVTPVITAALLPGPVAA